MQIVFWIAVFGVSLLVLVKAAGFFTTAAEKIGLSLGISPFIVGVVIVGFGTSLPELVSSVLAVSANSSEMVIGNVLGSNITNIFLVLGIAAVFRREVRVKYDVLKVDLPILLGSSFLIAFTVWDRRFTLGEAGLCLVCLAFYIFSAISSSRPEKSPRKREIGPGAAAGTDAGSGPSQAGPASHAASSVPSPSPKAREQKHPPAVLNWVLLIVGSAFIFVGAKYVVESVIRLSEILSIGKDIIALSAVSIGTSLPEVTVAITASRKGNAELVLGNVIGSNIFNSFAVMGIPALFGSLEIPRQILQMPLPMSVAACLLAVIIMVDRRLNRWEGALLLTFYAFFLGSLFGLF